MNQQKKILEEFMDLYDRPTFRGIADLTGINLTRVFRLFNGSIMKLTEYQSFKDLIDSKKSYSDLVYLINECEEKLKNDSLLELETIMSRKLQAWKFKRSSNE